MPSSAGIGWCQVMRMPSRTSVRALTSGTGLIVISSFAGSLDPASPTRTDASGRYAIMQLLRDILDAEREHLAESRRVTERSLELQQRAVAQQEQVSRLYRRLVLVGGGLVAVLLAVFIYLVLIYYLLAGW